MSRFLKFLNLAVPLIGAIAGFAGGLPIWRAGAAVPADSVAAWLWVLGGFAAFTGGVLLLRHLRWIALIYVFAGFLLLFSAGLYLPEARRAYDEWQHPISHVRFLLRAEKLAMSVEFLGHSVSPGCDANVTVAHASVLA